VLRRDRDPHGLLYLFAAQPDLEVYCSNDLFNKHPTKPNFWLPRGRADDLTKNFNLTKFNATHVETVIESHPRVQGALMGGQAEKLPFLILEASDGSGTLGEDEVVEQVWPAVEEANKMMSEEIRLRRDRIILVKPEKPFRRLGKGLVNR